MSSEPEGKSASRVVPLNLALRKGYKSRLIPGAQILQSHQQLPELSSAPPKIKQMDSFATVSMPTSSIPTSQETGGSGGNAYCVVSRTESIPTNEETGGSGGNAYCIVA